MTEKLTELCYQKVARLMQDSYWSRRRLPQQNSASVLPRLLNENPFACLPTTVVDKLVSYFDQISEIDGPDWQLLLTSGRIRHFNLDQNKSVYKHCLTYLKHLENAFLCLSLFSSRNLTTIKINQNCMEVPSITEALDQLLRQSPNLRKVESDVKFHFRSLNNCVHLEELVIKFRLDDDNPVHEFLNVNGQIRPLRSLKRFALEKNFAHGRFSWVEIHKEAVIDLASILTNCTELIYLDCDLSRTFEYHHLKELHNGSLTERYKLQRCFLKCNNSVPVSKDAIQIASVTCPDLREVFVCTNDEGVSSLSSFRNLMHLNIHWTPMEEANKFLLIFAGCDNTLSYFSFFEGLLHPGDYTVAMKPLLEEPEFGHKLVSLQLISITNVDFASIGASCPNLKELEIFYDTENNRSEFLPTSFRKLISLKLRKNFDAVEADTLVGILKWAFNLETLIVNTAEKFTDAVLREILKINSFSRLADFEIIDYGLSLRGITSIASTMRNLKHFKYYDPQNSSAVEAIFKEYNSNVTVKIYADSYLQAERRIVCDYVNQIC